MSIPHPFALLKRAAIAWNNDDAASMGAALVYYTLFSIAPLLVMVIAVAGLIFGRDASQSHILGQLRSLTWSVKVFRHFPGLQVSLSRPRSVTVVSRVIER